MRVSNWRYVRYWLINGALGDAARPRYSRQRLFALLEEGISRRRRAFPALEALE